MVNNETRLFGIYVLSQVIPQLTGLTSDHYVMLTKLVNAGFLPNFDIQTYKNRTITENEWTHQICPRVINHLEQSFEPGKLKASA